MNRSTTISVRSAAATLASVCLAVALAAAPVACGGSSASPGSSSQSSHKSSLSPMPTGSSGSSVNPSTGTPSSRVTVSVYFMHTVGDDHYIVAAHRRILVTTAIAQQTMAALLAGPNVAERAAGYESLIPTGTRLLGLTIMHGIATVDLDGTYESGEGLLSTTGRLGQVVYTLTQFPSINGVLFEIDHKKVSVFGDEGIAIDTPQRRADYEDITPPILIESPTLGDTVRSPLLVVGTANVFEAQFAVELLDGSGTMLLRRSVEAGSGTGTRGPFSILLDFSTTSAAGTLVALDVEGESADPVFEARVPLTLGH